MGKNKSLKDNSISISQPPSQLHRRNPVLLRPPKLLLLFWKIKLGIRDASVRVSLL